MTGSVCVVDSNRITAACTRCSTASHLFHLNNLSKVTGVVCLLVVAFFEARAELTFFVAGAFRAVAFTAAVFAAAGLRFAVVEAFFVVDFDCVVAICLHYSTGRKLILPCTEHGTCPAQFLMYISDDSLRQHKIPITAQFRSQ